MRIQHKNKQSTSNSFLCALHAACMSVAHINNSTWNNVVYFPQAPVSIYLLECGEGIGANLAKGSDLVTNNLGNDWTGDHYIL